MCWCSATSASRRSSRSRSAAASVRCRFTCCTSSSWPGYPEVLVVSNIVEERQADRSRRCRPFLAFRPLVQGEAEPRFAAACAGVAGRRRRHAVRQHAPRVGHACPRICAARWKGARPSTRISRKYAELQKRSPWRPNLSAGADRPGEAGRAADRAHASGDRAQGAVRQRAFHDPHRSACRKTRAARCSTNSSRIACAPSISTGINGREHDLVFWDNRSLMHLAAGTPDHLRRKLYRTTIEGDAPF